MLKVTSKQIIPTSEARKNFKDLIEKAKGDKYFLITRTGSPAVVVADVEYFEEIVDKAERKSKR